jgi:DNA-binding GntR family transcriptional regulator
MREAIKVLAAEGLITMKLRRGAYVTEVNRGDLEQIFTVLSLLEGEAAKKAATKAKESDLNALDDLHLRLEKAAADRNLDLFFDTNVRFHERIIAIAANPWMTSVIADLRKVLKLQRKDSLSRTGRLQQSLSEHREILKALLKRDPVAAEQAMRTHLAHGLEAAK